MTSAVRAILDSIEALSPDERHELIVELLRLDSTADIPDEAFVESAEGLFSELDRRETDADPFV